jgi:acetyltransferase-like isoleucine patch superfamily enzyme
VTLTHEDDVDDFVTLAAGVSLGGGVHVGRCAYLGMNSSVRQQVLVGDNAVVGMGAAVLDDVPRGEVWAGVPARQLSVSGSGSSGSIGREAS